MVQKPYSGDPDFASSAHEPCEARVQYLAQSAAELADYYEGILFTLRRQRDTAQLELQVAKEHLAALQVTP